MKVSVKTAADIGRVIRASRQAMGMRLDDTAGSCGLSAVFVGDAEHGKETAQIGKVLHLMSELGIKITLEIPDYFKSNLEKLTEQGFPNRKQNE